MKERMVEKLCWWIAYRLPRRVVYFASIRLIANATTGQYGDTEAPGILAMDAVGRWEWDQSITKGKRT